MVYLRFPHTVPSPHSIVDKVIRLRVGRLGVRMPAGVRIYFCSETTIPPPGAHLSSSSMDNRFLTPGESVGRLMFTIHSYRAPRLRMSGVVPPLPPCASMLRRGQNVCYPYTEVISKLRYTQFSSVYAQ